MIIQTQSTSLVQGMTRVLSFTLVGCVAAFSLFVIMSKLADFSDTSYAPVHKPIDVTIFNAREERPNNSIVRVMPEPPKLTAPPKPTLPQPTNDSTAIDVFSEFDISIPKVDPGIGNSLGTQNQTAIPLVRVQPSYPIVAAQNGIEGWVKLSFSINEIGKVFDVKVVDSSPKRVFDKEARKALRRWQYKPQIVNGEAVKVFNQMVSLEFKTEQ